MYKLFEISNRGILVCLIGLWLICSALPACAQDTDTDFDYDIFLTDDTLSVWLDIRPALDQAKMEDLLAGLDLSISIEFKAERPRKLLFSKTLASARAAVLISHPLTEDIYRLRLINIGISDFEFKSQIALSDFLADSLILRIGPKILFDEASDINLDIEIVSKSHSSNILEDFPDRSSEELQARPGSDEEFFESIFSLFLNIIGFGKTSYRIESPSFSIEDLESF